MQIEVGPLRPEILRQFGLLDTWTDDEQIAATAHGLAHPGEECGVGLDAAIADHIRLVMQMLRRQMRMDGCRGDARQSNAENPRNKVVDPNDGVRM
ncbi:hypothetical protein [Bradyrhizobium uaiense]|uniref:hypothetical protein n=1 Tax=Bradyrhizobium uaiense TaxID=2594946 RepID=UPI0013D3FF40|nr:hypothetical protein [Bradyrhizobium uaiense]